MKDFLSSLIVVIVLTGCSSYMIRGQFDKSLDAYNQSLRWLEWGNASLYTKDSIQEEYKTRTLAAKDVRIADYRIVNKTYNAEKREAIVEVEIDYYKNFSLTIRTLRDTQRWAYLDENGTKGWRLTSLLPEFR
jgi:hypothetical protein